MTRIDEITRVATLKYSPNSVSFDAFVMGAEYADMTMIDKACEWLGNELKETDNKNGYPTVEGLYFVSVKEFIREFRQAMEGGAE